MTEEDYSFDDALGHREHTINKLYSFVLRKLKSHTKQDVGPKVWKIHEGLDGFSQEATRNLLPAVIEKLRLEGFDVYCAEGARGNRGREPLEMGQFWALELNPANPKKLS